MNNTVNFVIMISFQCCGQNAISGFLAEIDDQVDTVAMLLSLVDQSYKVTCELAVVGKTG